MQKDVFRFHGLCNRRETRAHSFNAGQQTSCCWVDIAMDTEAACVHRQHVCKSAPLRLLSIRPEVIVGKLALVTVQYSLIFRHLPKSSASDQSISKWFYVIPIPFQWFRNLQDSKLAWKTSSEFSRPALNAQKVSSLWGIETPKISKVPNGAWELGF